MGARSQTETLAKILFAFVGKTTWSQSELAAHVGVQPRTVREHLNSLADAGVPLEREEEHPHVLWTVPNGWFPGGAVLTEEQLEALARLVAREPETAERERLLRALLKRLDVALQPSDERLGVSHADLCVFEDAACLRASLSMRYFSASRGDNATRHVSVHRVRYAPRPSIVATCHRDRTLKWFRLDRASSPRLDADEPYLDAASDHVQEFIRTSFEGFRSSQRDAVTVRFRARWPDARWFVRDLEADADVQHTTQDFVLVEVRTAAIEALARRLVGLGDLITAETEELRQAIVTLAKGALTTNDPETR